MKQSYFDLMLAVAFGILAWMGYLNCNVYSKLLGML
jgi:hypothetical protein